jgi:peptide-methionine (S)-S-oxide reductase
MTTIRKSINQEQESELKEMEIATFAAGCFWGIEAAFREVEGVASARVGYTGGLLDNPTYKDVCSGRTGHAEAVEVTYDPAIVSYDRLLGVFWEVHNPTTLNRQGPDIGPQYRSAIFFHNPVQERAALASKENLQGSGKYNREIVTEITPASTFWEGEDYHQQYLAKRGLAHCRV